MGGNSAALAQVLVRLPPDGETLEEGSDSVTQTEASTPRRIKRHISSFKITPCLSVFTSPPSSSMIGPACDPLLPPVDPG
eukprot:5016552-Pyramimonas_sp.AAC.1